MRRWWTTALRRLHMMRRSHGSLALVLAGGGREQGRTVVPQELRDGRLGLPRISVSGGEGGGVCGRGGRGAAAVREEAEAEVERGAGSVACYGFGERDEERSRGRETRRGSESRVRGCVGRFLSFIPSSFSVRGWVRLCFF